MPNQLNKPISSGFRNTYTSQFVPLPLELFARANERDQKTQDDFVAQTEATSDGLWKINAVAPDDQAYLDTFKQGFSDAASRLVNTNLTQKENQDSVKKLIKDTSRDKDLNTIMTVSSQYQTAQENRSAMIKDNTYNRFNDIAADSYEDYVKSGGYKSGKGLSTDIIKYEDTRPAREKLVDDMRANGNDIVAKFGETFYKNGYEGISKSQAYNTAKSSLTEYMQTNAGAQDAREFRMMQRNNPKNKELQKMDEGDYIFSKILTAANERVFSKTTSGLAEAKNKDKKDKEEKVSLFNGLASNEVPSTLLDGLDVKYNAKGNIQGDGKGIFANIKESMSAGNYNPIDMYTKWRNDDRLSDEQNTRLKSVLVGAKLSGVTDTEYIKHFNKTWAPVIPEPLTGKALTNNNNAFYNGGAGLWSHMILSKDGKGAMGLVEALENEFGDVPDPKKDAEGFQDFMKLHKVQVTGAYAPNKLSARPIEITVNGTTFAADLTNGGKNMNGVSEEAHTAHNLARLNAGEQIEEKDSKGNTVIYFKNLSKKDPKTGDYIVDHRIIPKK